MEGIEVQASGRKFVFTRPQGITSKRLFPETCGTKQVTGLAVPAVRFITHFIVQIDTQLPRNTKTAALMVSLMFSAFLTATVLMMPDCQWLSWISFLPLFVVVRSLRAPAAVLAGGFWGGCLYLFATRCLTFDVEGLAPAIVPSAWLLVLLIAIPAVYVGLAARLTRAIGFKLLMLALGWTLVEVVLLVNHPNAHELRDLTQAVLQYQPDSSALLSHCGLHHDLLAGSQGVGQPLHLVAHLLGYIFVAFLIGCANASLVSLMCRTHFSFPPTMLLLGSSNAVGWLPSQVSVALQFWILRQTPPRAPPIPNDLCT